jgi:hypothetical protein
VLHAFSDTLLQRPEDVRNVKHPEPSDHLVVDSYDGAEAKKSVAEFLLTSATQRSWDAVQQGEMGEHLDIGQVDKLLLQVLNVRTGGHHQRRKRKELALKAA